MLAVRSVAQVHRTEVSRRFDCDASVGLSDFGLRIWRLGFRL